MDQNTVTVEVVDVFEEEVQTGHYQADAFVVRCMDNRFWLQTKHFIKKKGLGHIDPQSPAGGAKVFATPEKEGDRDFMLRELKKSIELHGTSRVILFTHHDCGAYGGIKRFNGDVVAELNFHIEEHRVAQNAIRQIFPELTVESYFNSGKSIKKIDFQKVGV